MGEKMKVDLGKKMNRGLAKYSVKYLLIWYLIW